MQRFNVAAAAAVRHATVGAVLGASLMSAVAVRAAEPALTTMAGDAATVEDYTGAGKWLVVMIWSVNCGICYEEMPSYGALHSARKKHDLRVLGVSLDGRATVPLIQAFLDDREASFPNLVADIGPFAREYAEQVGDELRGTPTFLVFDPGGKLVGSQPGPMKIAALERFIDRKNAEAGR